VIAEIYRAGGEWKFNAIGSGFKGGLAALATNYGLQV
jgi:tellurium resistance protein TerD